MNSNFKKLFTALFASLVLVSGAGAYSATTTQAQEEPVAPQGEVISSYHSDIVVNQDSTLAVTETITVTSTGDSIRHGIYRDFPTKYTDKRGNKVHITFRVTGARRGGEVEPFHTENRSNGVRVYLGSADVEIPSGEHTYALSYTVNRELGFFPDHDELYWNVIGTGWEFPILKASATVTLPSGIGASTITADGFTGQFGETGKNFINLISDSKVEFTATETIFPGSGFTIVVGFPKGFVKEPTTQQKLTWLLQDNAGILAGLLFLLLITLAYLWLWFRHGRDPKQQTIIPQYDAPQDFTPALVSYVQYMGNRQEAFTASVVSAAAQGALAIEQNGSKMYTLVKAAGMKELAPEEKALVEKLFASAESVEVASINQTTLAAATKAHHAQVTKQAGKEYFVLNLGYVGLGIVASIVSVFLTATLQPAAYILVLLVVALFVVNLCFAFLLPRRTEHGKRIWEHIQGLKLYLSVAEADRLQFHNPPEKTPQLYEKLLPYAIALGVEIAWSKQFTEVFAAQAAETGHPYTPTWFVGTGLQNFSVNSFGSSFGSSISSSSTPPGSSSGFGGGGSSGGGGGGGGGGGW